MRNHTKVSDFVKNAPQETMESFARAIFAQPKVTSATGEKALIAIYPPALHWSQTNRKKAAAGLEMRHEVMVELGKLRDASFAKDLVGKNERRAILAALQRTPLTDLLSANGELAPFGKLTRAQKLTLKKLKVTTSVTEAGSETKREVETYDRIAAARLDAELDGDLVGRGAAVQVNTVGATQVNLGLFSLPVADVPPADWDSALD